jgi:hypothetical protein
MQIDFKEKHLENAHFSIRHSFDPNSKVTFSRRLHCEKQKSGKISTDDGIQIDFIDEQLEKVDFSIRRSDDGETNVTLATNLRDGKPRKQIPERTSTEAGME